MSDDQSRVIDKIFFPENQALFEKAKRGEVFLAHYTHASTAYEILRNEEFWLRSPSLMNDYNEISFGKRIVEEAILNDDGFKKIDAVIERYSRNYDDIPSYSLQEFKRRFSDIMEKAKNTILVGCLSEHDLNDEDQYGRLSMWRAYCPKGNGCAVIHKAEPLADQNSVILTMMITYGEDDCRQKARNLVDRIYNMYDDEIRLIDFGLLIGHLFMSMVLFCYMFKHKAFYEEKEWRTIHISDFLSSFNSGNERRKIDRKVYCINDIPQEVGILPLHDERDPDNHFSIRRQLHKILIGPTQFPEQAEQIQKTFIQLLKGKGYDSPESKVCISGVPLRL